MATTSDIKPIINKDIKYSAVFYAVNLIIQFFYATEVCPYIETLTAMQVFILVLTSSVVVYAIRGIWLTIKPYKSLDSLLQRRRVLYDTMFFVLMTIIIGTYNFFVFDFPVGSAGKLIAGFTAIGFFSSVVLYLLRHVYVIKYNISSIQVVKKAKTSLASSLMLFTLLIVLLCTGVTLLIIFKDLTWVAENPNMDVKQTVKEIGIEIIFIAIIFLAFSLVITYLYTKYLSLQIAEQTNVLNDVSKGKFNTHLSIRSRDEFGEIALFTNQMINKLKENKELINSIEYAKRLQHAILPSKEFIDSIPNKNFTFYAPRDIVSGDFYAYYKSINKEGEELLIFAVADCTGHGVPGAMVSMVCSSALSRCVNELKLTQPALILDKTREFVIESFAKATHDVNDGMDIGLCVLNKKTNTLEFAGANNTMYLISSLKEVKMKVEEHTEVVGAKLKDEANTSSLFEIKGCKQPIGKYQYAKNFKNHILQLNKGDVLYLFSDGYVDQFGGEKGKKYKHASFRELLHSISSLSFDEQLSTLEQDFLSWKGQKEQTDDVCVLSLQV